MIGICTDSNSQISPELADRYGVAVVPLTIVIDGESFLEGVNLDADGFWARFQSGVTEVSTAAPSPGQVSAAYETLIARGATSILSVHVSPEVSSTFDVARLAARSARVEVRVVDSGTASFGVSCAVWEAAEAIRSGAGLGEAADLARQVGERTRNVFVLGTLELARRGGRLMPGLQTEPGHKTGVPILSMIGGKMVEVGRVDNLDEACGAMADYIGDLGPSPRRVAVGTADPGTEALASALEKRLRSTVEVVDLVRYRIGPSVGAHTGPGTAGAYFYALS